MGIWQRLEPCELPHLDIAASELQRNLDGRLLAGRCKPQTRREIRLVQEYMSFSICWNQSARPDTARVFCLLWLCQIQLTSPDVATEPCLP